MKFDLKVKALVAAIALALAGPAVAAINVGGTGNGELFLSVWNTKGTADSADDTSYTLDLGGVLGGNLNDWANAANPPVVNTGVIAIGFNVSYALPGFTSFLSGADSSSIFWNVAAFDSSGPRRALTTGLGAPAPTNLQLTNGISDGQVYLSSANVLGNHGTVANGVNTATNADGDAFAASDRWGSDFGGFFPGYNNAGNLGDSLSVFLISTNGTNTSNQTLARVAQFGTELALAQWKLTADGVSYSVTAVPEPGTWAMLVAGLLGIGAIARRRL